MNTSYYRNFLGGVARIVNVTPRVARKFAGNFSIVARLDRSPRADDPSSKPFCFRPRREASKYKTLDSRGAVGEKKWRAAAGVSQPMPGNVAP
ncbi:hypothetical protein GGD83_002162 [Rhodoblastus sphagnicola]|uniref:hypothetical protein n=1 Tax=Rhodoblastus sphagnicola TaxID=333368 RepID=UPI0011B0CB50|nr:hypothetical protein [Rhodoblastus sphagnicola]MBB4198362.1 hypothetical protein [Rhodoblastus sphagnicola]